MEVEPVNFDAQKIAEAQMAIKQLDEVAIDFIGNLEAALTRMKIEVPVREGIPTKSQLLWRKHEGKWHIMVPGKGGPKLLTQVSHAERMVLIEKNLPQLISGILPAYEFEIWRTKRALKEIQAIIALIKEQTS